MDGENNLFLAKFNKIKMEFLENQRRSESFEEFAPSIYNSGKGENEYIEKLNIYREIIKSKEEEKFILDQGKEEFFDFFEKLLTDFYSFKNLKESKENLENLYKVLSDNKKIIFHPSNLNKKKQLFNRIYENFEILKKSINTDLNTTIENESIKKLQFFVNEIKLFSGKIISSPNFENELNLSNSNNINLNKKRRNQLLSTAYIKKSQSKFGENDVVIPVGNLRESKLNNRKMILRNFLQIYLIKENEIFSESYFSKYDHTVLYKYRKYKFYQIKLCFSILEPKEKIESHLKFVKELFEKYLLLTKIKPAGNFLTYIICGVGKNQSLMKRSLIKYINNYITNDCLIKISLFSNLFDCVGSKLSQCLDHGSYNYESSTNFKESLIKKIFAKKKLFKENI